MDASIQYIAVALPLRLKDLPKLGAFNNVFRVFWLGSGVVALVGVAWLLYYAVYQTWFHPLAKYPGPFLARYTDLRAAYCTRTGDLHLDMWKCHQKYGPYVRYAPDRLLINTPRGMREMQDKQRNLTKSSLYTVMVHRVPSTFTTRDKKTHGKKRRITSQGVSDAAIRNFEPVILQHIKRLCDSVAPGCGSPSDEKGWSEGFDMASAASYLTFDTITHMLFGKSYNLSHSEEFRWLVDAIKESNKRVSVLIQAPSLLFRRLDKKLFPRSILSRNKFLSFVKLLLGERMAKQQAQNDIFSGLQSARDPDTGELLNIHELNAECISLLVAGSDTTSTFLSALLFYLAKNSAAYDRLVQEICTTFSEPSEVRLGAKLSSCRYLRACMDEALRMSPPVGEALYREALRGGATVDGIYIPEGITVGTSLYAIHHEQAYWEDPFTYSPERWLGTAGLSRTATGIDAFGPFSVGGWSCMGKSLALAQGMLTVATLLRTFYFELVPGREEVGGGDRDARVMGRHRPDEYQLREHVTSDCTGPILRFKKRQAVSNVDAI